MITKTVI